MELFFKWIKQHLRIKSFYGTSENAVKTQIWIAVSIYVLIRYRPETPRAGSESLPDSTDSQRYAIRKMPVYRHSSHPTPKTNPPMTPTN